jgi:hypothetical protein
MTESMTLRELDVLDHAYAWHRLKKAERSRPVPPVLRNHFCAGPGHHDWDALQALCARGLMRVFRAPHEIAGGDTTFSVTDAGVAALKRWRP